MNIQSSSDVIQGKHASIVLKTSGTKIIKTISFVCHQAHTFDSPNGSGSDAFCGHLYHGLLCIITAYIRFSINRVSIIPHLFALHKRIVLIKIETQLCLYMKNSTKQWEDQIGLCQKYINYQQRYKPVKHMYYHYCMIITVLLNEDHHCILHQATSRHKYQSTRWLYIYTQAKLPTPSDPYYLSQIRMYLSLKCV
jgi:hypothetical protein